MKRYHEWRQKARQRYLEGYYPGHNRLPNSIVLLLYGIGHFIGDFVPLIMNLIEGVYLTIKRLVAFIIGLLVEASIFIVLAGSVVFSVAHSIERLRRSGATSGLEYVGVLMFEVIFIGSAAMLTGFLMKKKIPKGFIEWLGLSLTILGFIVGLVFVWWSNINGMAPTTEGLIIGSAVPLLVLIGEGILAYRFILESNEDNSLQEFIIRNGLTIEEVKEVIEHLKNKRKEVVHDTEKTVENDTENGEKTNPEMVLETDKKDTQNGDEIGSETNHEMVSDPIQNLTENGSDSEPKTNPDIDPDMEQNHNQNDTKKDNENDHGYDSALEKDIYEKQDESMVTSEKPKPEFGSDWKNGAGGLVDQTETNDEHKNEPENEPEMVQPDNKNETKNGENSSQKNEPEMDHNLNHTDNEKTHQKHKKTTDKTNSQDEERKIRRRAMNWGDKFAKTTGKPPGRVRIAKNVPGCTDSIAREVAEKLRKKYKNKAS